MIRRGLLYTAGWLVVLFCTSLALLLTLFSYDYILGTMQNPGRDLSKPHIASFDLYPFTGFHMQPDFHHTGSGQDIHSGQMGFWTPDFDFKNPPTKEAGELRVILIGGSGAQGQAPDAVRDGLTIHAQIEQRLKAAIPNRLIRVISMAMGGSTTYQNFIALNLWGHKINPDMIVSYSGFNEWHVPLTYERGPESFLGFSRLSAMSIAAQSHEWPPALEWMPKWFPNIAFHSRISVPLKLLLGSDYFGRRAQEQLARNLRHSFKNDAEMIFAGASPFHIDALKAIKRDFGKPVALVWQVVDRSSFDFFSKDSDGTFEFEMYDDLFDRTKTELDGYRGKDWIFWNAHREYQGRSSVDYTFHLSVKAQAEIAARIADIIVPHLALPNSPAIQ